MQQVRTYTDWPGLLSSLLVQLLFVGWLVWLALWPSGQHDEVISDTLVLLLPFEVIRSVLLFFLSTAYREYKNRWQAVKNFLGMVAFFACFALLVSLLPSRHSHSLSSGLFELVAELARPWFWLAFLVPVALLVAENAESLYLFRGDPRRQAARLDAMANDSLSWLGIGMMLAGALAIFLVLARATVQEWVELSLLYAAAYFAAKAIILANVYTARFALTGRRVLAAKWLIKIANKKEDLEKKLVDEQYAAGWRRAVMLGEEAPSPIA